MTRYLLSLMALAMFAGCSSSINPFSKSSMSTEERTQRAAFAASIQYPQDMQAKTDLEVFSVVPQSGDTLTIYNASNRALRDVRVWTNGAYVARVDSIAPMAYVKLNRGEFFGPSGISLADQNATITRVELQTENNLYKVQGPIRQ